MKKITALVLALVVAMSMFTGCTKKDVSVSGTDSGEKALPKVGFVYVGPVGDGGYTYSHDQGRIYLEKELGVETTFVENVEEGPECEKVLNDLIDQGCNVIFATSFGFMDYVEKVAAENPDVKFFHCSGYKNAENFTNYFGRIYQARYLSGIVAGLKTETNEIGYVAAFGIPEVVRGINAFTLGVQSVNPEAVVKVKWTNTWYDPAKEKEAGKALLDENCDVIAQHQDTAGPQQAAEERGKWAIGYNTDSRKEAPGSFMTAPIWNWGPYYVSGVQSVIDGTFQSESYWGGMETGTVALAELTELAPAEAQAAVDAAKAEKIKDGTDTIFTGEILDQEGNVKVAAGQSMTDEELLSFNWFVKGVIGKLE